MTALEVQVQSECRHLAALRVRVQALGPALGLSEECALALLVLWTPTFLKKSRAARAVELTSDHQNQDFATGNEKSEDPAKMTHQYLTV